MSCRFIWTNNLIPATLRGRISYTVAMPITRRTSTVAPGRANGWTHLIVTRHFTAGIRVQDRKVVDAEAQLHWTVNQRFDRVVELCNNVGSEIKPVERKR